ncbi:hypothetical protein KY289_030303 [Solanum tuberosum]|nr:hypothetical protein KY289_030303 [Solanum tuberosum]
MICGCGLNNYLDGSNPALPRILDVSESILSQLIRAETTRGAWEKLIAAYACGSKPLIRELKAYLHNLSRDNATIESYVQGGKAIADNLAA